MHMKAIMWKGHILGVIHDSGFADESLEDGYEIMDVSICPECNGIGVVIQKKEKDE